MTTTTIPAAEIVALTAHITAAYLNITSGKTGTWVGLSRIRRAIEAKLGRTIDQKTWTEAIRRMNRQQNIRVIPESVQKAITDELRYGAVFFGGQWKHHIAVIG